MDIGHFEIDSHATSIISAKIQSSIDMMVGITSDFMGKCTELAKKKLQAKAYEEILPKFYSDVFKSLHEEIALPTKFMLDKTNTQQHSLGYFINYGGKDVISGTYMNEIDRIIENVNSYVKKVEESAQEKHKVQISNSKGNPRKKDIESFKEIIATYKKSLVSELDRSASEMDKYDPENRIYLFASALLRFYKDRIADDFDKKITNSLKKEIEEKCN